MPNGKRYLDGYVHRNLISRASSTIFRASHKQSQPFSANSSSMYTLESMIDFDMREASLAATFARRVATTIGSAAAPEGYEIVDEACPDDLDQEDKLQNFIGKLILVGHDTDSISGWFVGIIHSTALSPRDKLKTPTANFVVKYTRALTGTTALVGTEARELSANTFGASAWWVFVKASA